MGVSANDTTTFTNPVSGQDTWKKMFEDGFAPVFADFQKAAQAMRLDTSKLAAQTFAVSSSAGPAGDEGVSATIAAGIAQVTEQMAAQLIPTLKDFQAEEETLLQTFVRLSAEFQYVDRLLVMMGKTSLQAFGSVGTASLEMRDKLVQLMGGLQQATALTASYYENFHTDAERHAADLKLVNAAMTELGLSSLPATRAEFRALVEAQDLATDSGQEMFAALMQLAPAFASVTQSMEEAALAADSLANRVTATQAAALRSVSDQIAASRAAASAASQSAQSYRQITGSLMDAMARIRGNTAAGSAASLDSLFATAMTGDAAALSALPKAAEDFLAASLKTSSTATAYAADQARVLNMLGKAGLVSEAQTNWAEYQAALLETQTGVLEQIKAQLELPSPDLAVLNQQTELLNTIAGLLQDQTTQIVGGNSMQAVLMHDQTGKIILANALSTDQTGQIVLGNSWLQQQAALLAGQTVEIAGGNLLVRDQTGLIVAGNALLQDQSGRISLGNALLFDQTGQLVTANSIAAAVRAATDAELAAVMTAAAAAASTAQAQTAVQDTQAAVAATIEDATVAAMRQWLAVLTADDPQTFDGMSLAEVRAYIAAHSHADGGIASGWSLVGERGPELVDFTSPGRVYTASQTRSMMGGGGEIAEEIRALRAEVAGLRAENNSGNMSIIRHAKATADKLDDVTEGGNAFRVTADADAPLFVDQVS